MISSYREVAKNRNTGEDTEFGSATRSSSNLKLKLIASNTPIHPAGDGTKNQSHHNHQRGSFAILLLSIDVSNPEGPEMPFRLHVIRHAQGTYNTKHGITILWAPLKEKGIQQSEYLTLSLPIQREGWISDNLYASAHSLHGNRRLRTINR